MPKFFKHPELMQSPPIKRAAYSDRTAWIMAEFSRLVYERLPNEYELEALIQRLTQAIHKNAPKRDLISITSELAASTNELRESPTEAVLKTHKYELINAHAEAGTECMVVKIAPNEETRFAGMFVIVFRGTEPTSLTDLRSDLSASLVPAEGGGYVHAGFMKAYEHVAGLLEEDLKKAGDLPIYITGHSLGGALALVATRYICNDSLGATYTFGGPRVGDDAFFEKIKTPVYRIVNAADGVARIPFGCGFSILLAGIRLIPINGTRIIARWLAKRFSGYTHYGDMKLLTAPSHLKDLQVLSSPSIFKTSFVIAPRMIASTGKAAFQDHSMVEYCDKLSAYALKRL
ncbi:lipase family protein [Pseudodesulfovibrio sp.]|uniref:lipase family protein n=1 Tax=unclassified Pseudodesulfovibrio TaxID=2661612 RepID=UPI003AFFBF6A